MENGCSSCKRLSRQIEALNQQVQSLGKQKAALVARNRSLQQKLHQESALLLRAQARIQELEQVRRPTASNSSTAPSANPPGARPPVSKKPTGRKPGAQPGHPGKARTLVPPEQVQEVIDHRPELCGHCRSPLDAAVPGEVVGRHQVAELPPVAVVICEHRSLACRCGRCGRLSRGRIPPEILCSVSGPRLSAAIALLCAWIKGSKRDVSMVLGEVLGSPLALGSVCAREREISQSLAGVYQDLRQKAAAAKVKYVDETGWKLRGKARWLWVSADRDQVLYRIERSRTGVSLPEVYGVRRLVGVFCTDRAGIYDRLKHRGLCWAHLKRDFTAVIERGGAGEAAGWKMLQVTRLMFKLWHRFKDRQIGRRKLMAKIEPLKRQMRQALQEGAACGQKKTAGLCRRLLKLERAMWRFASTPGLEPTNNLAERMLRTAVIWRKRCFGNASVGGCRYVERTLSVIQTLRLREQKVLEYLSQAILAYRRGQAPPVLPDAAKKGQNRGLAVREAEEMRKVA